MPRLFENSSRMFFISLVPLVLPRGCCSQFANSCLTQLLLLSNSSTSFCSSTGSFPSRSLEGRCTLGSAPGLPPLALHLWWCSCHLHRDHASPITSLLALSNTQVPQIAHLAVDVSQACRSSLGYTYHNHPLGMFCPPSLLTPCCHL